MKVVSRTSFDFRKRLLSGVVKAALPAAILATSAAAAWPTSAAEIFLRSLSMDTSHVVNIAGAPGGGYPNLSENAYSSLMIFQANNGVGPQTPTFELLAFCIDIFDNIGLGAVNNQYHTDVLSQDGRGDPLSPGQIQQISGLVNLGTHLYKVGDPDLSNRLAGVQGAIWRIENPLYAISSGGTVGGYIDSYTALAPKLHGSIYTIYPDAANSQGFGVGVPEPAAWTLMLLGFGGLGAALRRRRTHTRLAVT